MLARVAAVALLALVLPPLAGAATVSLTRGELAVAAGPGEANEIAVTEGTDGTLWVTDVGAPVTAGTGCSVRAANTAECDGAVDSLTVHAGDGDDRVLNAVYVPCELYGEAGNDALEGAGPIASLFGGPGDDKLVAGADIGILDGGRGADTLSPGSLFSVAIANYGRRAAAVRVTLDGIANDGEPGEGDNATPDVAVVQGGWGNDRLTGSDEGVNVLLGARGNDVLDAAGGVLDLVLAGRGNDRVLGGAGAGVLVGGAGHDLVLGGAGRDTLFGGADADLLHGGTGPDELYGELGPDRIYGDAGADKLRSLDGWRDLVDGGAGSDSAKVERRRDVVRRIETVHRFARRTRAAREPSAVGYLRSLLDSMSNHMAKSKSWSPEITRRATRTMVAEGIGFPAILKAVSTIPRSSPTLKNKRPSP